MQLQYIGYQFNVSPLQPGVEILIAQLGETAFESFEETETGVNAYIQKADWTPTILDTIGVLQSDEFEIDFTFEEIEQVNWNEEWEKNFDPIVVDDLCCVRAPFHEKTDAEFDIVIEPKMSFGTGHHETTHMMLAHLLEMELTNKATLDMGCGTAVLAILAALKGAQPIDAIDIDNWCYQNSIENAARNQVGFINVYEGDAALLQTQKYDVIIANINRNILLNDMATYVKCMNENAVLLLSGFYTEDIPAIQSCCEALGLTLENRKEKNNWVALKMIKK